MNQEKIRVGTLTIRENQLTSEIETAVSQINGPLRTAMEKIGFTPSEDLIRDSLNGARKITGEYIQRLNKDLSIMTIPATRELFEKSGNEALKEFHEVRKQVSGKCGKFVGKYISFSNEIAVFNSTARQRLDEDCGIYLENKEEIELYRLHEKACEALNNMFQGHNSVSWNSLFDKDEAGNFIPNQMVNYDVLLKNIKKVNENGN